MTREQLALLIEYIDVRAEIAAKVGRGDGVSPRSYERLTDIVEELEELCQEPTP